MWEKRTPIHRWWERKLMQFPWKSGQGIFQTHQIENCHVTQPSHAQNVPEGLQVSTPQRRLLHVACGIS